MAITTNLDITPGGVKPRVHVSQYDVGRQLTFSLYDGATAYTIPSGSTVIIEGIKPDMHGFQYETPWSGSTVTVSLTEQMTVLQGVVECEIRVRKGNTDIGTANFHMCVERTPINQDTIVSDSDLPLIIELATKQMEAAAESAKESADSATLSESWAIGGTGTREGENTNNSKYYSEQSSDYANNSAGSASEAADRVLDAEAWARGSRDGEDVGEDDETYHNNSKYYSEQSSDYANNSANSASEAAERVFDAEAWARGSRDGVDVDGDDETYHNNSKYYSEQSSGYADDSADSARLSESWAIGGTGSRQGEDSNNSKYYSSLSQAAYNAAKAQADRAEEYADFITPHFVIVNNRLYLRDDAVPEFVVANNRLYIKIAA